eukprot:6214572-Pleurochrysis_carterae.AAC.2
MSLCMGTGHSPYPPLVAYAGTRLLPAEITIWMHKLRCKFHQMCMTMLVRSSVRGPKLSRSRTVWGWVRCT